MKKIVFVFAAMLAIAASCTKEETQINNEYDGIAPVFTASVGATKAELIGTKVNWVASDHIAVWNGTVAADYSTTGSGATADFTTTDDTFTSAANYVALYPYDGSASFTSGSITTVLPAAQTATAAGFDPAANIAVASSSTTSLSFHTAVAYVKFTVPSGMDDLTSVSFKGNNSENVAGACSVNTSTYALTATGSETATLSGTFTEGSTYYLAVAPQAYSAGYTVTITRTGGTYEMVSKATSITFERSAARDIGNLWDGTILLEGSAIASATPMTVITGTTQHDLVYSFRGALSTGKLNVRKEYSSTAIHSNIDIPSDGNYHILYNATTGRFRVYSQDILVDFANTDAPSVTGTTSAPWNMITAVNSTTDVNDFNGNSTGLQVIVGAFPSIYKGTGGGDSSGPTIYIDDDELVRGAWYDGLELDITSQSSDSDPYSVSINGLDNAGHYDIRVVSMRFNATASARRNKYRVVGNSTSDYTAVYQGYGRGSWAGYTAYDFRSNNIVDFDNIQPNASGIIDIQVVAMNVSGRTSIHFNCFRISKVVYSQN
ncbi:MAG: hypothetical protein IKN93_02680 [Bacteroidales bacterium]|nr:hypothetical protein [Bacteroidales bacterium]